MSRRLSAAVTVVAAIGALVAPGGAAAAPVVDSSELRDAVTVEGVLTHMEAFQTIADANGGTREASGPGFDASVDYVESLLREAGYETARQEFEYAYFEELAPATLARTSPDPLTYVDGTDIATMGYSGNGTFSGVVQATNDVVVPLPVGQPDGTSNSGCEPEDFDGFTGDIALVQRGTCDFSVKVANAVAAGADAVIIFNEGNTEERSGVGFGQATFPQDVPVLEMSAEAGAALVELIRAGEPVTLEGSASTVSETRTSQNLIADLPGGRTDRTVVSGAHLDSVAEGPGINDNGSGSAGQLETALQIAEQGLEPVNHLRFIWFGAEEAGLVGSQYYVDQLTKRELKDIAVMLNFDMIGSPNPGWFVYDGDASDTASTGSAGSGVVESVFVGFFDSIDRITEPTAFDGRSDYDAFVAAGIPAGGLFTGAEDPKTKEQADPDYWGGAAGIPYDPCYHEACDTIDNLDETALDEMSDALAHGVWTFASTSSAVQGTSKGNATGQYDPSFKGSSAIR